MEDVSMMMVDSPTTSHLQPQAFLSRIAQISFTPTAAGKRSLPRAWERIPSTAFLARHKSRKIWKRFRKSMELLRERTGPATVSSKLEETEFESEISASANADYRRAVKRQRLDLGRTQNGETDGYDENNNAQMERGRSFLETKWELEIGRRRRKLTQQPFDTEEMPALDELLEEATRLTSPETDSCAAGDAVNPTIHLASSEAAAEIVEIVARQEPNLVRSALRMNSLDGEDVALLSEFLSRAQAKRAANAAMMPNKPEESAVKSPRRALEELDKNSPSPQKIQVSTPSKRADKVGDNARDTVADSPTPKSLPSHDINEDTAREESSPSARRRSTRTKLLKAPQTQTHSQRPAVPNQIPVRRANGTEFVFLQRTEAQELALVTRKNTRRNKGNAVLPKYFLKQDQSSSNDRSTQESGDAKGQRRSRSGLKQVSWRDEELVEYAPERQFESLESASPERKSGKSRSHALPATPSKKVRRINIAGPASTSTSTNPIMKPLSVGTPIPKRNKLTPKAPSESTLPKSRPSADKKPSEAATSKSSSVPKPVSQRASSIPKSKSLLKAPSLSAGSSAGATPVAKRVRAKKIPA